MICLCSLRTTSGEFSHIITHRCMPSHTSPHHRLLASALLTLQPSSPSLFMSCLPFPSLVSFSDSFPPHTFLASSLHHSSLNLFDLCSLSLSIPFFSPSSFLPLSLSLVSPPSHSLFIPSFFPPTFLLSQYLPVSLLSSFLFPPFHIFVCPSFLPLSFCYLISSIPPSSSLLSLILHLLLRPPALSLSLLFLLPLSILSPSPTGVVNDKQGQLLCMQVCDSLRPFRFPVASL